MTDNGRRASKTWLVTYAIDVEAETPRHAAELVAEHLADGYAERSMFDVQEIGETGDEMGPIHTVDLAGEEPSDG